MSIIELGEIFDRQLVIRNRYHPEEWYCSFDGLAELEISPGVLSSCTGEGITPKDALKDYVLKISGKTIVFNSGTPTERVYKVPQLSSEGVVGW